METICSATGKVKHATEQGARYHARSVGRSRKGLVFPYLCPHCNTWHVGHQYAFYRWKHRPKKRTSNSTGSDSGTQSGGATGDTGVRKASPSG